ncbi:MAG: hypothetical protein E6J90_18845 [Deltaproteobacteria bacterium]|nr:MAG: hypothetical protein E6J90_18845 [Deltaproteobacteria bacterium]
MMTITAISTMKGTNNIAVGRGVFKLISRKRMTITADTDGTVIIATETKDGNWPDPSALNVGSDGAADVQGFFGDLTGQDTPV